MATQRERQDFGRYCLQTAWLFQALCALPTLLILGFLAFAQLFEPHIHLYGFITDTSTAIMAAGIIFIVLVQRRARPHTSASLTLAFETGKLALAFALWLWLILDAAFGPWDRYYYNRPEDRHGRIVRAAVSHVLIWILFVPTVAYAAYLWKHEDVSVGALTRDEEAVGDAEAPNEGSPLLGR